MAISNKIPKSVISLLRDIGLAFLIVIVIMLVLFAYSGIWPPMVVIESESMQHSDDTSYIGVIDTGDLVLVKKTVSRGDVTTYIEGRATNYKTYSDYGDVVIYRRGGSYTTTPIIHRAILWLEWNSTNNSFNAPDLALLEYGVDWAVSVGSSPYNITGNIILYGVGYENRTVTIRPSMLERHSGFITMGDHNCAKWLDAYDRSIVHEDWVEGKGRGELPWFGMIKLTFSGDIQWGDGPQNSWYNLAITLTILIVTPILIDFVSNLLAKRKEKEIEEDVEEGGGVEEDVEEGGGVEEDVEEGGGVEEDVEEGGGVEEDNEEGIEEIKDSTEETNDDEKEEGKDGETDTDDAISE